MRTQHEFLVGLLLDSETSVVVKDEVMRWIVTLGNVATAGSLLGGYGSEL